MATRRARRGARTVAPHQVASGSMNLNLSWDTGDTSQWTANGWGSVEVGVNPQPPGHMVVVQNTVTRLGSGYACRFEMHNAAGDANSNGNFRSLWSKYDTDDGGNGGANTDECWAFSFRLDIANANYFSIWELHQRAAIYSVDGDLSLAPHAFMIRSGQLQYRLMAGKAVYSGGQWVYYTVYQDLVMLLPSYSANTWYDVLVDLHLSESSDGVTDIHIRQAGAAWPSSPNWHFVGANMQWIPAYDGTANTDPNITTAIHTTDVEAGTGLSGMFVTTGQYTGSPTWSEAQSPINVWIGEHRRYTTIAAAKALNWGGI